MTRIHVIENRMSHARKYLAILERFHQYSQEQIEQDVTLRGAVERYLYLATQATIDLAEAVIAHREYRKPTSMSECFSILEEEGVIGAALADCLIQMTGFRNVIAHDYVAIDYAKLYHVLHDDLKDIEEFLNSVAVATGARR